MKLLAGIVCAMVAVGTLVGQAVQAQGGLGGVIRDSQGGVMAGVTVAAVGLIGGTRTSVTSAEATARALSLVRARIPTLTPSAPGPVPTVPVRVGGDVVEPRKTRHGQAIEVVMTASVVFSGC